MNWIVTPQTGKGPGTGDNPMRDMCVWSLFFGIVGIVLLCAGEAKLCKDLVIYQST